MGSIRLADDPELGRQFALKLLRVPDTDAAEQFLEEAQITAQLEHPNIVPVHDVGRDDAGRPWLAMKRIEGDSLAAVIEEWRRRGKRGRLGMKDYATILTAFDKVCDAVAFAHSRGVIHRDIKPANVMVGSFGEVLLLDWGLAKPLGRDSRRVVRSTRRAGDEDVTLAGDVFGTPAYMSPEQARGAVTEVDERSDVFSLGATLYHLLTLQPPFTGKHSADVLARARQHRFVPPRRRAPAHRIPRELEAVVLKAMARDPGARYGAVRELQEDLAAWQANRSTVALPPGPFARMLKAIRRHPTAAITGALVLSFSLAVVALVGQVRAARAGAELAKAEQEREAARRAAAESEARAAREQGRAAAAEADAANERALLADVSKAAAEGELEVVRDLLAERGQEARVLANARILAALRIHAERDPLAPVGAVTREELERYEQAFAYLEQVAERSDYQLTADDYFSRGFLRRANGTDPRLAISDFTAAFELDPRHSEALRLRGSSLRDLREWEAALDDYGAALRIDPDCGDVYRDRGRLWAAREEWTRAVSDYSRALELVPTDWMAFHGRALAFVATGQPEAALRDYNEALRLHPDDPAALNDRGSLLLGLDRTTEAVRDFAAALDLDPSNVAARVNRAQANYFLGNRKQVVEDCSAAIDAGSGSAAGSREHRWLAVAYRLRGSIRLDGGDVPLAIEDFTQSLSIVPDAATYFGRAVAQFQTGDLEATVDDCDHAVALDPTLWRAWWHRAAATQNSDRGATLHALNQAYRFCTDEAERLRIADQIQRLGGRLPE